MQRVLNITELQPSCMYTIFFHDIRIARIFSSIQEILLPYKENGSFGAIVHRNRSLRSPRTGKKDSLGRRSGENRFLLAVQHVPDDEAPPSRGSETSLPNLFLTFSFSLILSRPRRHIFIKNKRCVCQTTDGELSRL
jgi:hypothetical protein